jgi:hypothetical protein
MHRRSFFAKTFFGFAAGLNLTAVQARDLSGVSMPETVNVEGKTLRLNGMGVRREVVFIKEYVIALYLEKPTTRGEVAVQSDAAKRVVLTMLRDVSQDMFVEAIESGIMRNSAPDMPRLRARLDQLEQAVPDLKKGDVIDLTWLPGDGTVVRGHGKSLTIPGKDLADAMFSIWLGPNPVEASLKRDLLGG